MLLPFLCQYHALTSFSLILGSIVFVVFEPENTGEHEKHDRENECGQPEWWQRVVEGIEDKTAPCPVTV